jgi:hypothetical protein
MDALSSQTHLDKEVDYHHVGKPIANSCIFTTSKQPLFSHQDLQQRLSKNMPSAVPPSDTRTQAPRDEIISKIILHRSPCSSINC